MTRPVRFRRWKPVGVLLMLGVFALGCGGAGEPMAQGSAAVLDVVPRIANLTPGATTNFAALSQGAAISGVGWFASAGSITSTGLFTAPAEAGSYQIQARIGGAVGSATAVVSAPGTPASFYAAASSTCANMPLRTTGTTYYFCDCAAGAQPGCVAGDDANAGTSPNAPKRTWGAAVTAFNAMQAGDTIALCRGGAFPVGATGDCTNQMANTRCAAGSNLTDPANATTCDVRDYSPSTFTGSARPVLFASTTGITRFISRGLGTTNGVRVLNLEFRGGNAGPRGGTYYNHTAVVFGACNASTNSSWLICNNDFNHLRIGIESRGANPVSAMNIWGNRFEMNDLDAILSGPGTNGKIDANYFDNNGGFGNHPATGNNAHTLYLTSDGGETTGASIINNEFRRTGAGGTPGVCSTGIVMGHERFEGLNVENNIIDGGTPPSTTCWGLDLSHGGVHPTYYRNTTIRRNWINSGGEGIALGQATNSTIENNVVVQTTTSGWKVGIMAPYAASSSGDDVSSNITIRNNTVYQGAGGSYGVFMGDVNEGSGHVLANNVVVAPSGSCFGTTPDAGDYAFVGNNACSGGAAWGTNFGSPNLTAPPQFVNAPANFTPAAGSPLIGAGGAAFAPSWDFTLKTRPTPPSIGAYEP